MYIRIYYYSRDTKAFRISKDCDWGPPSLGNKPQQGTITVPSTRVWRRRFLAPAGPGDQGEAREGKKASDLRVYEILLVAHHHAHP